MNLAKPPFALTSQPQRKLRLSYDLPAIKYTVCDYLPMDVELFNVLFGDIAQYFSADQHNQVQGYFMQGQLYIAKTLSDDHIVQVMHSIIEGVTRNLAND